MVFLLEASIEDPAGDQSVCGRGTAPRGASHRFIESNIRNAIYDHHEEPLNTG